MLKRFCFIFEAQNYEKKFMNKIQVFLYTIVTAKNIIFSLALKAFIAQNNRFYIDVQMEVKNLSYINKFICLTPVSVSVTEADTLTL